MTPVTLGIVVAAPRLRLRAEGANSGVSFVAKGMEKHLHSLSGERATVAGVLNEPGLD